MATISFLFHSLRGSSECNKSWKLNNLYKCLEKIKYKTASFSDKIRKYKIFNYEVTGRINIKFGEGAGIQDKCTKINRFSLFKRCTWKCKSDYILSSTGKKKKNRKTP